MNLEAANRFNPALWASVNLLRRFGQTQERAEIRPENSTDFFVKICLPSIERESLEFAHKKWMDAILYMFETPLEI